MNIFKEICNQTDYWTTCPDLNLPYSFHCPTNTSVTQNIYYTGI